MRIVVLGAGGARKTEASIVRAARSLGHGCRLVDVVRWRRYAGSWSGPFVGYLTHSFEPDFVLLTRHAIQLGEAVLQRLLRGRTAAFWYFDFEPKESVLSLARMVGRMYVTCLPLVDYYRAASVEEVHFMPQGVDPEYDAPADAAPSEYQCDASFVGSGQATHRYAVLRAVAAVSRLQIRGHGWKTAPADLPVVGGPVYGDRLRQVIRGASISLGANSHPAQDTERASVSNRMWKVLGCGGFYLGRRVDDIESFAKDGLHCAWYRDETHAAELTRQYLSQPDARDRIALAGRAHALGHHTYAHRLALLLAGKGYPLQTIS
jgi:hypothetical protein